MLVDHENQPFRVKLIDFGLACDASCLPQGCVVGALFLMERLFDGKNENDMMRCIVELLGQPPNQILDAGLKTQEYFCFCPRNHSWQLRNDINYSGKAGYKLLHSLDDILYALPVEDSRGQELFLFVDMLKKMLDPDPTARITPEQLLQHGFLTNADGASPSKEPEPTAGEDRRHLRRAKATKRTHESVDEDAGQNSKRARNAV
uniref:Protein kinase domain-containing protein n=1 Tax=Tetraodon nigroviridis TaxID=99883 RepID=H3C4H7_TETNG